MIYLNREPVSIFRVNQDLIIEYKSICDRYLINIRRNLTKQLIPDKVYYDLKMVLNSYGTIINNLLNSRYESLEHLKKNISEFSSSCNVFLKNSDTIIPENVHNLVDDDLKRLKLSVNKLLYIIENFCDSSEDY